MSNQTFGDAYAVTMFSFTNEILRANRTPVQLVRELLESGITKNIEVDGPQHFRGYPNHDVSESQQLREVVASGGGRCTLLGGYADRALGSKILNSDSIVSSIAAQLQVASRMGAYGLRVQADALTSNEAKSVASIARDSNVQILFELQGSMTPAAPATMACLEVVESVDSDYVGIMFDSSLFMTAFPAPLRRAMSQRGLTEVMVQELEQRWLDSDLPAYRGWVMSQLQGGHLPPATGQFLPTLFSRMGHGRPSDWESLAPQVRSVQLKFWDQQDRDGALESTTTELMRMLSAIGYEGFYCSEWGGHEWYSLDQVSAFDAVGWHRDLVERSWVRSNLGESNF